MEIRNLKNINVEELLTVFNKSFSDYVVPFHLSLEQLQLKIETEKIDMNLSVGVFESDKLEGFILQAWKEENGQHIIYNAGTGITREYRGKGLVRKMYDFIMPVLKERKADVLVLEVIDRNTPAIRAYENQGFKIVRRLLCFNGMIDLKEKNTEILIEEMENFQWEVFQSFWDIEPSWQNSAVILSGMEKKYRILGAYKKEQLVGYAVYNSESRKVCQIAVDKNVRRQGIGSELFRAIGSLCAGQAVSVNNVDDISENTSAFLERTVGLKNWISQFEMKKEI
ncbi:GNAT family N-acetyltransferase [Chryseobacterium sp. W4I1]|uniref:GNAT family N-acetyltransferase n=1 Tax=Chryseobacterium sp. W4I1 TaxID=3042293 RepID=UPI002786DEE5|nr:GNAT family N-acetyltransferase [Chryseobacterium sp. W4I1]MDQ0783255.1 ribosomal protein S18 acetylase RimI-like enzyme [Chryseobacterium sp. W4I1]